MVILNNFRIGAYNTLTICNSQHPVAAYLDSLVLTRVKSTDDKYKDLFYVVISGNEYVMTYRIEPYSAGTIQLHKLSFEEFRAKVVAKEDLASDYELVNCDKKNKWVGNDILWYLECEGLTE